MRERTSAVFLFVGLAAGLVTMSLHPTLRDLLAPGAFESAARRNLLAHGLAVFGLPFVVAGCVGLARRLPAAGLAWLGLAFEGLAAVAVVPAAIASGWIGTELARAVAERGGEMRELERELLRLNGHVNQAFAEVHVVAAALAIMLWSLAILARGGFPRALGYTGGLLATATLAGLLSGHLRLDVHGFGLVVLGQALWLGACAVALWRGARGG